MGMISKIHAEINAKKLENIILTAMNSSRWGDVRSAVKGFVKEELVGWYLNECEEGFIEPNEKILKAFPPKKNK